MEEVLKEIICRRTNSFFSEKGDKYESDGVTPLKGYPFTSMK